MYNYKENVKVNYTPHNDVVISTNDEIFAVWLNALSDSIIKADEEGRKATKEDLKELWNVLYEQSNKR